MEASDQLHTLANFIPWGVGTVPNGEEAVLVPELVSMWSQRKNISAPAKNWTLVTCHIDLCQLISVNDLCN
jgi:hypothetical protein